MNGTLSMLVAMGDRPIRTKSEGTIDESQKVNEET
jgi:hypothetical protein